MREPPQCCNREPLPSKMRHIRNSLAISSLRQRPSLLSDCGAIIGRVGDSRLDRISPGKVSFNCLRLHRWPGRSQAAAFEFSRGLGNFGAGEGRMATALIDLYGGEEFERFDRIILPEGYRPTEEEDFMCSKHRAYFLRKLKAWKEDIIEESRATMAQLQVDSLREPDIADRASSETDWGIELRTRDRQRKLISKIDCAIRRLYEGEYGYCEVSGDPISLGRLEARPIATMTLEAQERHERIERISRDD